MLPLPAMFRRLYFPQLVQRVGQDEVFVADFRECGVAVLRQPQDVVWKGAPGPRAPGIRDDVAQQFGQGMYLQLRCLSRSDDKVVDRPVRRVVEGGAHRRIRHLPGITVRRRRESSLQFPNHANPSRTGRLDDAPVGELLGGFEGLHDLLVSEERWHLPATGAAEETPLALADLRGQGSHHRLNIGALEPLLLGHLRTSPSASPSLAVPPGTSSTIPSALSRRIPPAIAPHASPPPVAHGRTRPARTPPRNPAWPPALHTK